MNCGRESTTCCTQNLTPHYKKRFQLAVGLGAQRGAKGRRAFAASLLSVKLETVESECIGNFILRNDDNPCRLQLLNQYTNFMFRYAFWKQGRDCTRERF